MEKWSSKMYFAITLWDTIGYGGHSSRLGRLPYIVSMLSVLYKNTALTANNVMCLKLLLASPEVSGIAKAKEI
jgi:hypothetical protein